MTTAIVNARIVNRGAEREGWVVMRDDIIAATGGADEPCPAADLTVDAEGMLLMPGAIDTHVHFRDPGLTAKGDMATESRAAAAGGVTSVIDMPNTIPPTVTAADIEAKMQRAQEVSAVNYAFFIGATPGNINTLIHRTDYSRIAGVKLFLGSTTGDMMLDDDNAVRRLMGSVKAPVVVHAESEPVIRRNLATLNPDRLADLPIEMHPRIRSAEACYESSARIVAMAREYGTRLHLAHVSTARELGLLQTGLPPAQKRITAETCPQYLLFSDADFLTLGARIKCNPAIKSAADRDALRRAVADGTIDTIATDHAPHLLSDKCGGALQAKSGMPMVQFSMVKMLDLFDPATVARVMAHNPAQIFRVRGRGFIEPGMKADLVLVRRLDTTRTIADAEVVSRCGWTPLDGMPTHHCIERTYINGRSVHKGEALRFDC